MEPFFPYPSWCTLVATLWKAACTFGYKNLELIRLLNIFFFFLTTELTPEERAQKIAKAMRKQSSEVKEKWESLNAVTSSWQKQVDKALEKLRDLQGAMDDLDADMKEAEAMRNGWKPVGDLLIDSLQDHIEKIMVSIPASDKGFLKICYCYI